MPKINTKFFLACRPVTAFLRRRVLAVLLALCALSACASCLDQASKASLQPTTREYLAIQRLSYDDILTAALRAMTKNLNIKYMDQQKGIIRAKLSNWGFTEYLEVSIKPVPFGHRLETKSTSINSNKRAVAKIIEDIQVNLRRTPSYKEGDVRLVSERL